MNVQFAVADNYSFNPTIDLTKIKDIGPIWGGWQTWRACSTDNVICYDIDKARELIDNKFHTACNFYIREKLFNELTDKKNIRAFGSEFQHTVDLPDQIVALFLAATSADIVLLTGYVLNENDSHDQGYLYQGLLTFPDTQFVVVDALEPSTKYKNLDNLTHDTLENVIRMLV